MTRNNDLLTKQGRELRELPHAEYPRPTMRRDSFFCLNGKWEFAAGKQKELPREFPQTILVPFAPQSRLSGICRDFGDDDYLFYRRRFTLPPDFVRARTILHFGAVDQVATVYLNGVEIGTHTGGYDAFCFDITDRLLNGENTLCVRVFDRLGDAVLPYGKQKYRRGGMWYTAISGIWQTVWIESLPREAIESVRFEQAENGVFVLVKGVGRAEIELACQPGKTHTVTGDNCFIPIESPRLWSPEDPFLYHVRVRAGEDAVESYFALRRLEIGNVDGIPRLLLNGKPYFFHGVLDQGYYPDGIFTPADPELFEQDILAMKALGFNTLRKHIKVEPELFYYACDRLGMVVFQDMVNNGKYSFLRDTALPTFGAVKRDDRKMHRDPATREAFVRGMETTVKAVQKHPCVCAYTIYNEGWGQFESERMYHHLRALDDTRFIDTTSGWFRCGESDVESIHVYFKPVRLPQSEKPILLSEFGGYSFKPIGHTYKNGFSFGYRFFKSQAAFMDAFERLYTEQVIPAVKNGLCGAIYTQLSDVEDETNGMLSYDREVCKMDTARMQQIAKALSKAL